MDEADLVGIHEARVAHHVAAVGQVDRHDRAASVLHRRGAMRAQRSLERRKVAPGKQLLDPRHELRVDRHHIAADAVLVAGLFHQDLAVALDDVGLDLAGATVHQIGQLAPSRQDVFADFLHTLGAQRVGLPGPAERGKRALAALEQRPGCPSRVRRRLLELRVEKLHKRPSSLRHGHRYARGLLC
jgi:hypothetical protein